VLVLVTPLPMACQIWTENRMVMVQMGSERQHRTPIHQRPMDEHNQSGLAHASPSEAGVAGKRSPTGRITRQGLP